MKTTETPVPQPAESGATVAEADAHPAARRPSGGRKGGGVLNVFSHGVLVIWAIMVVMPLVWAVMTSFKDDRSIFSSPWSLPDRLHLDNWARAWTDAHMSEYFLNTVLVTAAVVAIVLLLIPPLSYAIVRSQGRATTGVFRLFLLGVAIPAQAVVVPLYLLISQLNLYDSLIAIILPTAAFAMPVSVLILTGTMRDISEEMYEAMALDGASTTRMLFQLVIPMTKGGISTVVIYSALQAWNGFLFPLIFTQSDGPRVLTLGLFNYVSQFGVNIPALLASVVLSGIPIFAVYLVARRALVNGLMGVGGK